MVWEPTARVLTVMVGSKTKVVPRLVLPSKNVTVPVGVPAPAPVTETAALNVTGWPYTDGFTEELTVVLVDALLTIWMRGELVLGAKLLSPPYLAVIECEPAETNAKVKVAFPELTVPVPKVLSPSMKVTVPDGFKADREVIEIVALKVTDWPYADGLFVDVTDVVVEINAGFTVWVRTGDVLPNQWMSPPYSAVMEWLPILNGDGVVNAAVEVVESWWVRVTGGPSGVEPSMNVTVPSGTSKEVTVAVKVTSSPYADGFSEEVSVFDVENFTTWVRTGDVLPA
jgi:hypothetical protein